MIPEIPRALAGRYCPVIAFSEIAKGKYKLNVLFWLSKGPMRFGELRKILAINCMGKETAPRLVSRELKHLEKLGLITRKQFAVIPPKVEYSVTPLGLTIVPIVERIVKWGIDGHHEAILGLRRPKMRARR